MVAVIQRCLHTTVTIDGKRHSEIGSGLLLLLGIEVADTQEDIVWLAAKVAQLRIFNDDNGVMNKSVKETGGEILIVSQFTLMAGTKKGNRPSYAKAAPPSIAIPLYEAFKTAVAQLLGKPVAEGVFGADMQVSLVNDGPVTIIIDTKNKQ